MTEFSIEYYILRKSLYSELTEEEANRLKQWLEGSSSHQLYYDKIKRFHHKHNLSDNSSTTNLFSSPSKKRFTIKKLLPYAAVIVLAITISIPLLKPITRNEETKEITINEDVLPFIISKNGELQRIEEPSLSLKTAETLKSTQNLQESISPVHIADTQTLIVPRGREFKIELSDGTLVWLNAESNISYPVTFGEDIREVHLNGEAYFEVSENQNAPFIIYTNDIKIQVYGTSFNINTYTEDNIQVVLVEGSVGVSSQSGKFEEQFLEPHEMITIQTNGEFEIRTVHTDIYTTWNKGYFSFESETVEQIIEKLLRWYDVEIVLINRENQTEQFTFSGQIEKLKNIDDILDIMAATHLIDFKTNGKTIEVYY